LLLTVLDHERGHAGIIARVSMGIMNNCRERENDIRIGISAVRSGDWPEGAGAFYRLTRKQGGPLKCRYEQGDGGIWDVAWSALPQHKIPILGLIGPGKDCDLDGQLFGPCAPESRPPPSAKKSLKSP